MFSFHFILFIVKMASMELACVYAALVLNDDNIEITNEKIQTLLETAGVKVETYWIDLFTEYFKTHDISELIKGTPLGCAPNSAASTASADANSPLTTEESKEDKKEEEEIEIAGGFDDLFG